ncbi:hypothetical protein DFA_05128 [Cavenderia fasciculata]|uniref:Uncharacterized protein n=1 Tax=Cavenderia fasciculata TaxID=261658 RepID=F4PNE5_CACFS|nr:uncharacterized protein DFA_05128 [Cavenderia fasciculata]EGG22998.1 hypothetical protein DFA_05128 [Cavenderia fasciculata]|eukprot:XP_004360849.1 hypothetical protein DFA_05128 [Cavenderia fasciculata]
MNVIIKKPKQSCLQDDDQYCILEFQGQFESDTLLQGETLGELTHVEKDIYSLQFGNQILEGKEIKLKNPLVILKKQFQDEEDQDNEMVDENDNGNNNKNDHNNIEYNLNATITSKICFSNRATTLIAQTSVKYGSPQQRRSPSSSPTSSTTSSPQNSNINGSNSTISTPPLTPPKFT